MIGVLEKDKDLFCWGEDNSIQQDIPAVDFAKVEFHQDENVKFACGIDSDRKLHCWGDILITFRMSQ